MANRFLTSLPAIRRRTNQLYGNANGLPGLPKTTYVTVGGQRLQAPRTQMRVLPPAPPVTTRLPPTRMAPISLPQGPDPVLSRRIDSLDMRINSTEQSNRTLLDELMRLQQDIKGTVRKNELGIQEERDARSRMEMTMRQSQGKFFELDERLKRCEDGVKDNRGAIQQLSMHVSNIEKMVTSLQNDQTDRKNDKSYQHQEMKNEIARLTQDNERVEKIMNNMREEARSSTNRVDNLHGEIGSLANNLRLQAKLMEENSRKPPPKTPGVEQRLLDNERANTDAKIMQLNTVIQDLTSRLNDEAKKREKAEKDVNNKINLITGDLNTSKSSGEKAQKEYDEKMKDLKSSFTETDKRQIHVEMSRISNDLNAKIDKNDAKLRADTLEKLTVIEKTLKDENKRREQKDKELDDKVGKATSDMQQRGDKDNADLKKAFDDHVQKNKQNLTALNKRMNDAEAAVRDNKLEMEKLLNAEIQERLKNDKLLDAKIDDLEDDVQLGFTTLQEQSAKPSDKNSSSKKNSKGSKTPASRGGGISYDEITRMQEENATGIRKQVAKDIGKMETRIAALETDMKQKDDVINSRMQTSKAEDKESTNVMGDQLQQQIDALVLKQNKLKKQVDDLGGKVEDTPKNLQSFKVETNDSIEKLSKDLEQEKKERKEDVDEIQKDIDRIVGDKEQGNIPSLAQLNLDVDQTQTGLKKCAESIHVVKTMLTDKIRDERNLREKEKSVLSSEVRLLDTKVKELKERIKGASMGTDDGMDDEDFL